jgi:tetratricopeptide (TPR) repeat protein
MALGGIDAQAAALLVSGQSGGEVEGALIWTVTAISDDGSEATVPFVIGLDAPSLLTGSDARQVPIEVYGYLIDGDGAVVRHVAEGVLLENRPQSGVTAGARLRFIGEFRLPPGLYSFRVMVRNHASGRFFLARNDLSVPGGDTGDLFLLPPLVAATSPVWVNIGRHDLDTASVAASLPGLDAWPSARPALSVAESLDMVVGCSGIDDRSRLTGRLVNVVGRSVQTLNLRVGAELDARGAPAFYRVSTAAIDVPAGRYRLVVELADSDTGRTVSQSLPIILGSEDWEPEQPSATEPRSAADASRERLQEEEFAAIYENALWLFSAGEPVRARRAVAELERRVVAETATHDWLKLRDTEIKVAKALVKKEPASLMALILLHRDMYGWYRTRQEPGLSEHSWTLTAALAEGASTVPGWEPPEGFIECVLLDLAGDLVQQGDVRRAQALLERAVKLAPSEQAVLFALAEVHEFSGDWYEAARYLERLVAENSDHYEGRLRLAVNQARLGSHRASEQLLRELLAEPAPEWLLALGYQELAQILVGDGRTDEAVELLREGLRKLPESQRLRIQLAHALDTALRPREAAAIVDELEAAGGQLESSPRVRYAEWPAIETDGVCGALEEARNEGLEALMRAVR